MTKSVLITLVLTGLFLGVLWLWFFDQPAADRVSFGAGSEQSQVETGESTKRMLYADRSGTVKSSANGAVSPNASSKRSSASNTSASRLNEPTRAAQSASTFRDEEQAGEYAIAGLVQDEDGSPLANIEVLAELMLPSDTHRSTEDSDVATKQSAWTDFEGFFLFKELVDGEYRIHVEPGVGFAPAETKVRVGVMSANLVVVKLREIQLFGIVSNMQGKPVEEVRVIAGPPTRVTDTDSEGDYQLDISIKGKNRPLTIHFRRAGYRDQSVRLDPADLDEFLDYFELDVSMEPLKGLTIVKGRLEDLDGQPVAGKIINMRSPKLQNSYRAQTDMKGHFSMEGVEPGEDYQVSVRPGADFRDYERAQLEIPANGLQFDIVLEPLNQGELFGFMTDVNGRPISGFALTLQSKAAAGRSIQVLGDSTGFFEVKKFPTGGALLKTNSYPVFETQGFNVSSETEEPVPVVLDIGPHTLFGRVKSVFGDTVAASEVSFGWQHSENGVQNYSARKTTADQNGDFVFTGLGPGEHTLRVNAPGFSMAVIKINVGLDSDNIIVELKEES